MASARRLLYVVNELQWFWTHRLPLARAARDAGWDVRVVSPPSTYVDLVTNAGFPVDAVLPPRAQNTIGAAAANVRQLASVYRSLRPSLVHHVTIKPVLFGTIAARLTRVHAVVNAVAGVGYAFMGHGLRGAVRRNGAARALRLAIGGVNGRMIFQNPEDLQTFVELGIVTPANAVLIRGHRDDMPNVLRQSTVVVLPSYREGLPKALLEAAACARPIVTNDVPGCREVVRADENGLLVPPRDPAALAQAIKTLVLDRPRAEQMGRLGRRLVETSFSQEYVVRQTLDVYNSLVG